MALLAAPAVGLALDKLGLDSHDMGALAAATGFFESVAIHGLHVVAFACGGYGICASVYCQVGCRHMLDEKQIGVWGSHRIGCGVSRGSKLFPTD